ncbi:phytochrome A-associated F-box protein [Cajanus cajan]|uniref:Phytochrome A-associated F-box protein n=1 Tax=Cajanus cajan TaxID=3821 RepID=A0A151U4E1_CAJCA|nr:phytochrome A-associated F-box protein [Cajanus cajan]KYP74192.1 Phytochrome A-associated F-box protein [Cajanus cajan]
MEESVFSLVSDDIVLAIFSKLEDDPRHWARVACVCTRFLSLVRHSCWRTKCSQTFPSLITDSPSASTSASLLKLAVCCPGLRHAGVAAKGADSRRPHLARGNWDLRREQGCKLLATQFRRDSLYLCDWPGCVHSQENRNYMLFRGLFQNFKATRVWRTINDDKRRKIHVECAFCTCRHTWDLGSAFCLRRGFGCHRDGEPVVRAFVCENGHVSGAWTHVPLYS